MFNKFPFNEFAFNSPLKNAHLSVLNETLDFYVSYNDFYLNDLKNTFCNIRYLDPKEIKYESHTYGNFGNYFNFSEESKAIKITGTIQADTREELLELIETMKSKLLTPNQYLVIKDFTKKRQVKAFCNSITFSEDHYNICWEDFEVTFLTFDYLEEYTPINGYINSSGNVNFNLFNPGTAESKLFFGLSFLSASSVDLIVLQVSGQDIIISSAIAAGDNLQIDGYKNLITLNGNLVDFDGEIPFLKAGDNNITITTTGTKNFDIVYKTNAAYK